MCKIVDNYWGRLIMLNGEDYYIVVLLKKQTVANYWHLPGKTDLLDINEAQNIPWISSIFDDNSIPSSTCKSKDVCI